MPSLGTLECHVELAETGLQLNEYDTFWASNAVECYIIIPNQPSPFQIRLSATGYFSPSLSAFVYIDGVFQCNRFKRGLLPPTNGSNLEESRVDFKFKSKDYTLQGGRMISHPWRFEKLNIGVLKHQEHSQKCRLLTNLPVVDADSAANINPHVAQNLGVIEVVVLRCSDDPKDSFNPWATPRLLRNPTTNRKQSSGQIGGRFDGPNDDPFGDYPYGFDGRGMDPSHRRNGYSRSHRHTRAHGNGAYEARQSAHRRHHAERDWSPDDRDDEYESTYYYTDEEIPKVRQHRHHRRANEDNYRRSHRQSARAPTPHPEYRSYPRNDGARCLGDKDPKAADPLYEAFQAGLHLGAKHAQESGSRDEPRRRRDHYTNPTSHDNTPTAKRDGTVPGIVINQFAGSGGARVETDFDPETGRRITRVNLSAPKPNPSFEFVIYSDSDSDQDDADVESIHPPRPRSRSPTTPARVRRDTDETLFSRLKNLITGYEDRKSDSGPTSKPSSFHSYVEEVVDEEYGGKSSAKTGNERELLAIQPSGGHVADEENTNGKPTSNKIVNTKPHNKSVEYMPMPGAFPSAGSPQRLIEEPKSGFEAAVRQTKAPGQRTYGKLFSTSGNDLRSQKEKDSDARISIWLDRTQGVPSDFKCNTQGKGRANYPAHIDSLPKVSFEGDRGRGRSRQRSPHHDRGASHDRRRCSICERYRRHQRGIHSHDYDNCDNQKNGSWDSNDQWDYGKFEKYTFRRYHSEAEKNTGNPDRNDWQKNDQSTNTQNNWDKSNVNTNSGWDKSNYQNNGWDSNNWNSNPNDQWSVNSDQNNGYTNNWANDPEPTAATHQVDTNLKSEEKQEAPKSDNPRSTQRTKEDIENVSKAREYWYKAAAGTRPGPLASPSNSSRKRGSAIPAEPLPTISAAAATARNVEHQVRGGPGLESSHKVGHPVYWDTLDRPFAVFRFRYRSRRCLEAVLGETITESPEELRGRLGALSRDELIEEVLRRKDGGDAEEKKQDEDVAEMKWD